MNKGLLILSLILMATGTAFNILNVFCENIIIKAVLFLTGTAAIIISVLCMVLSIDTDK